MAMTQGALEEFRVASEAVANSLHASWISQPVGMVVDGPWQYEVRPIASEYTVGAIHQLLPDTAALNPTWAFDTLKAAGVAPRERPISAGVARRISIPPLVVTPPTTAAAPAAQKATRTVAKLINFTVVDPDPILLREKPELAILHEGRRMLNAKDERGFLMDLATELGDKLTQHNAAREKVTYEGDDGTARSLKPIRLGHLDVVIVALKEYVEEVE